MVETTFVLCFAGIALAIFVGCICFEAGQARAKREAKLDARTAVEGHVYWLKERAADDAMRARQEGTLNGRNAERSRWEAAMKETLDG